MEDVLLFLIGFALSFGIGAALIRWYYWYQFKKAKL